MTDKIIVFVTCETAEQAASIAQTLVEEKLAACVNIIPSIRSCYRWEGKVTVSDETLCLIKTTRGRFLQVQERVIGLHSYSVPEIVAVSVEDGLPRYLEWIDQGVGG